PRWNERQNMAITLSTGIIIPEPGDYISSGGVDEMALGFRGANDAIEARSLIGHAHTWAEIKGKPTVFPPATHQHSITQVTGLRGELDSLATELAEKMDLESVELENGTDANTLITPGVYYESRSAGAGPNFPEQTAGVFTVTANPPREHVHQQFISFGAGTRYYVRARYNGNWSQWKQLVTEDYLNDEIDRVEGAIWEPRARSEEHTS